MAKKYKLYEILYQDSNFICDVEDAEEAINIAIGYFSIRFENLIEKSTIGYSINTNNGRGLIEVGCWSKDNFLIVSIFELKAKYEYV